MLVSTGPDGVIRLPAIHGRIIPSIASSTRGSATRWRREERRPPRRDPLNRLLISTLATAALLWAAAAGAVTRQVETDGDCHFTSMHVFGLHLEDIGDLAIVGSRIDACLVSGVALHGSSVRIAMEDCVITDRAA